MSTLILVRHGQSAWNLENRFTGWVDVDLTPKGETEALRAGGLLRAANFQHIDRCFVSPLKRAKHTASLIAQGLGEPLHLVEAPEMIERFYGGLTGLDKAETAAKHGDEQVHIWRRSYDIAPPALPADHEWHPANTPSFQGFPFTLPATESLKDVVDRVTPFYKNTLQPLLQDNATVLIVAHGNSIRALIKVIKNISDDAIADLEIATGTPVVVEFDQSGRYRSDHILA